MFDAVDVCDAAYGESRGEVYGCVHDDVGGNEREREQYCTRERLLMIAARSCVWFAANYLHVLASVVIADAVVLKSVNEFDHTREPTIGQPNVKL